MACHRQHATLERGGDVAGIAVGRDDVLARGDVAPFRPHPESLRLTRDPGHPRPGAQGDAVAPAGIEQALAVERRMQLAGTPHDHAAMVEVARDLVMLARLRQHVGLAAGVAIERVELAGKIVIMPRRVGADEAALALVAAFDPLAGDDFLEQRQRVRRIAQHGRSLARYFVSIRASAAREALAEVDAAADRAAVAAAGT